MTTSLATVISSRLIDLGLNLHSLAARLGYANLNKGSRRLQALMVGDIAGQAELVARLPAALQLSPETIADAVRATEAVKARADHDAFVPHAIIVTERTVPSQITFCAVSGGERALHISLDLTRP